MRSESSTSFSLTGAKVPGNESSWEREFQGTKVPGSESSMYGTFAPGSESTWERKFLLPHHLQTSQYDTLIAPDTFDMLFLGVLRCSWVYILAFFSQTSVARVRDTAVWHRSARASTGRRRSASFASPSNGFLSRSPCTCWIHLPMYNLTYTTNVHINTYNMYSTAVPHSLTLGMLPMLICKTLESSIKYTKGMMLLRASYWP